MVEFNFNYKGSSTVTGSADQTRMSFSPDTLRAPTFFRGRLRQGIAFREAVSALHDVVMSDLRFKPKDRTAYKAWLERQQLIDWAEVGRQRGGVVEEIRGIEGEMSAIHERQRERWNQFWRSQNRYFDYLRERDYSSWMAFDPVITVHPDEVFFECFSLDESSYGRLGASYEVFEDIQEFACGTTNIDYSENLYQEFQKIRSYKGTWFEVDPSGFSVKTGEDEAHKEVKIDLPDSWVRGFLQVNSAMSLPMASFTLDPMDVHNFCFVLRRHKELQGPRSMRYILKPGEPVRVVFEPWEIEVVCKRSIYTGEQAEEIRCWGRRRLLVLERLISVAKSFTVHLLGKGMPSFYVADLGDMSFTLGLSGWTRNDWAAAGNFDLMAPRARVDEWTARRVFEALKEGWRDTPESLATRLGMERATVLGALGAYTQAGRAIYDLNKKVYRARELSREPLPLDALRYSNPREAAAAKYVEEGQVRVTRADAGPNRALTLGGTVAERSKSYTPILTMDGDERIVSASCGCYWHSQNELRQGPCEHLLALRLAHERQRRKAGGRVWSW